MSQLGIMQVVDKKTRSDVDVKKSESRQLDRDISVILYTEIIRTVNSSLLKEDLARAQLPSIAVQDSVHQNRGAESSSFDHEIGHGAGHRVQTVIDALAVRDGLNVLDRLVRVFAVKYDHVDVLSERFFELVRLFLTTHQIDQVDAFVSKKGNISVNDCRPVKFWFMKVVACQSVTFVLQPFKGIN